MFFSVIVPIYKVEKYLPGCIESVLNQTFSDYELILVCDGAADRCPEICEEYAARDNRIKVIHKENGGLVSARQAGIREAIGDYVFHLDGDDALLPCALESAYEIIGKTQADMVSFSHQICIDGKPRQVVYDLPEEGLYHKAELEKKIYPHLLSDENMKHLFYFVWGKAIKRELATKHQLKVNPVISMGEDVCCCMPCYLEAETVYMSKKNVYLYTVRGDSLTTDFKTSQIEQVANAITYLRSISVPKQADFEEQLARYSCYLCFAILAAAAEGNHFRAVKELKNGILHSLHREEIKKARFEKITAKSRIAIALMKKQKIGLAFYFLYFCKELKRMKRGGNK